MIVSDNSDDVRSFSLPTIAVIVSILWFGEHNDYRSCNTMQEIYMGERLFIMRKRLSPSVLNDCIDWSGIP